MAESIQKSKQKVSSRNQQDPKKDSLSPKVQPSRKHNRKSENPTRVSTEQCASSSNPKHRNMLICKNSACRAVLSVEDTFCKRCSCCICHLFDDNKDPSLWLECSSDSVQQPHGDFYTCSLSCHIECAFQKGKVGVVDLGQLMQLDGSYCCASCGKVSGILGCWKKQLVIAKEARRVDVLCYRINLSYRLLDGTCRFKKLHDIVKEAKTKLETDVGPINGVSTKMDRRIVSRLSVANDIHTLCSLAIEEADKWLTSLSNVSPNSREDSLPAACKFLFEEVKSTSVVIVLIELSSSNDIIKGYKLWYCKTRDETHSNEPVCVVPRSERRVLISSLQPCTEYSFRIVSYTESGDLGHSEAKCFTKSVELIHNKKQQASSSSDQPNSNDTTTNNAVRSAAPSDIESDFGFRVRDLGKILRLAWAHERGCLNERCCQTGKENHHQNQALVRAPLPPPVELDLNVASVPDLNEDVVQLVESSRDDEPGEADRSNDSQNWTNQGPAAGEVPAVDSGEQHRKRMLEETHDCNSTLINGSPLGPAGSLDENFEYCVKIIRWLECEGHIKQEFRLKLLTWFSLKSTEQERRVVNTFIQTLMEDPSSLAGQLVDSFSDILSNKRPRNGFCSKLWH